MKKFFYTALLAVSSSVLFAQIPNSDFEIWNDLGDFEHPDQWYTMDFLFNGEVETVKETGGSISGDHAVEMENQKDDNDLVVRAMLLTGSDNFITPPGFPISVSPTSLKGYFEYEPNNGDSCSMHVYITRFDEQMQHREVIGYGVFTTADEVDEYAEFIAPITYTSTELPDSAFIVIYAGSTNDPQDGSRLTIDYLHFEFATTTAAELLFAENETCVYPVPASTHFTVRVDEENKEAWFQLFNASGDLQVSQSLMKGTTTIDVKQLPEGIYLFRISGNEKVRTGCLIVQR